MFVHSYSSRWTRVVCGGRNSWLISKEQWKVINPGKSTAAMRAVPFCRIWLEISVKPLILFLKTIVDNSFSLRCVSRKGSQKSLCVRSQIQCFLLIVDTCFPCCRIVFKIIFLAIDCGFYTESYSDAQFAYILMLWFSTFLMLPHFNKVPYVVETSSRKLLFFATS